MTVDVLDHRAIAHRLIEDKRRGRIGELAEGGLQGDDVIVAYGHVVAPELLAVSLSQPLDLLAERVRAWAAGR